MGTPDPKLYNGVPVQERSFYLSSAGAVSSGACQAVSLLALMALGSPSCPDWGILHHLLHAEADTLAV